MHRILVAEDEPHILLLIKRKLEAAGYLIIATEDGDDALRLALDDRPDLLLLDIMLPGTEGLDICRQVKAHYAQNPPPVILVSALGQQIDVEAGLAAGADDYIIKPFSPRRLLERIEKHLVA